MNYNIHEKRWGQNGGKEKDKIRKIGLFQNRLESTENTKEQIMTLSENYFVISTALNIGLLYI